MRVWSWTPTQYGLGECVVNQTEQAKPEWPRAAHGPLHSSDARSHERHQRDQPDERPGRAGERDRRRGAPNGRRPATQHPTQATQVAEAPFVCGHCGRRVPTLPSGGRHRNHCPYCLYSRHVDDSTTGDRASACGALMEPLGTFQRRNGEYALVHRCLGCGFERFNRIAADDDLPLALSLPSLAPRLAEGVPSTATVDGLAVPATGLSTGTHPTHKPSRRERQLAQSSATRNQAPDQDVEPTVMPNVVDDVDVVVVDEQ